jgi:hypothetical protein
MRTMAVVFYLQDWILVTVIRRKAENTPAF